MGGSPTGPEGSGDVVPPGPPEPHPYLADKPEDLLPPPPDGWGRREPSPERPPDDVFVVRNEEGASDTRVPTQTAPARDESSPALERVERELVSVRRAWTIGVVTAALLAGVVIYALLSPPQIMSVQSPSNAPALKKANARIGVLEGRVGDLKKEIERRTTNAGSRFKALKHCFNHALVIEQHRMDLLLRRRLTAKRYLGLSPPTCSS